MLVGALIALIALGGLLGLGGLAALWVVARRPAPALEAPPPPTPDDPPEPVDQRLRWLEGEDLLAYPAQLGGLLDQLLDAHRAAQAQLATLARRELELADKPGREDLARRYRQDAVALERRASAMRRVAGRVWHVQASLDLRARVAVAARHRPALDVPDLDAVDDLDAAARSLEGSVGELRAFVLRLAEAEQALAARAFRPPPSVELAEGALDALEAERAQGRAALEASRARMDALADGLTYLADRARTLAVSRGPAPEPRPPGDAAPLLDALAEAMDALQAMGAEGDHALADAALSRLAEGLGELEREGLEAEAEARAAMEVQALLQEPSLQGLSPPRRPRRQPQG